MKKISKFNATLSAAALLVSLAAASSGYADVNSGMLYGTYLGVDAVASKLKFEKDYGENIFSKKLAPGLNFFVGHMFHENVGAEVGFEWDKKMKRDVTVGSGSVVAGLNISNAVAPMAYKTTVKQRHPYFGIVIKTNPLINDSFFSLMLGVSVSHVEAKYNNYFSNLGPVNVTRTFSKNKVVSLVKAVFEHKFTNQFGLKALVSWRNTSKFKMKAKEVDANPNSQVKLKNTLNFGVGCSFYI